MATIRELDFQADLDATEEDYQQWRDKRERRHRRWRWFELWWQVPYDPT